MTDIGLLLYTARNIDTVSSLLFNREAASVNLDQPSTECLLLQILPEEAVFSQLPVHPSQKQLLQLDQQGSTPQFHPCIPALGQCNAKRNNRKGTHNMLEDQLLALNCDVNA